MNYSAVFKSKSIFYFFFYYLKKILIKYFCCNKLLCWNKNFAKVRFRWKYENLNFSQAHILITSAARWIINLKAASLYLSEIWLGLSTATADTNIMLWHLQFVEEKLLMSPELCTNNVTSAHRRSTNEAVLHFFKLKSLNQF